MPAINETGGFVSNGVTSIDAGATVSSMSVNLVSGSYTQLVFAEFGITATVTQAPGFLIRDASGNNLNCFYCVGELGLQPGGTGRFTNSPTGTAVVGMPMATKASYININGGGGLGFGRYFLNMVIHPTVGTNSTLMPPCATFKFSYLSNQSNRPVESGIGFVRGSASTTIATVTIVSPGTTMTGSMHSIKIGAPT